MAGAQNSIPENARTKTAKPWTYDPGQYPGLDAAIEMRAAMGGAVWGPHLIGQDFVTFGAFLNLAEVSEFFDKLFPVGSDQAHVLAWLQQRADQFMGSRAESRLRLTALIYESPLYAERGFRHVQNAFGSIFDQYDDLLGLQNRNAKLRDDPVRRAKTQSAYAERERMRKTQRRWAQT